MSTSLLFLGWLMVLGTSSAFAACPLPTGTAAERVDLATACLVENPADEQARRVLTFAAVETGDFDLALDTVSDGLVMHPGDADWNLLRIRVLAWQGALLRAERSFTNLPAPISEFREARRLHADLAFYAGHVEEAVLRYDLVLWGDPLDHEARWNRAVLNRTLGDELESRADFERLCREPSFKTRACAALNPPPRYRLTFSPALAVSGSTTDSGALLNLDTLWPQERQVGVGVELRRRDFAGAAAINDTLLQVTGAMSMSERLSLGAGASVGPGAELAPRLQLWVDSTYAATEHVDLSLRVWYLRSQVRGALVLVPALTVNPGHWTLDVRDFIAVRSGGDVTQSLLLRVRRSLGPVFSVMAGAGIGQGADYSGAPRSTDGDHFLLTAGLGLNLTAHRRLGLDYVFRRENAAGASGDRHGLTLVWIEEF